MSAPEKVNPQKGSQRQPPQQERKHAPSPGKEDGGLSIVDNPLIGHGAMSVDEAKADGKGLWLKREGQPPAYRNPFMVQMHGDKPVTLPRAEGFPRTVSRPNWMTQAKPKIGQPGDRFEQEADQVAEAVVSGKGKQMTPAPPTAPPSDGGPGTPPVQNSEFSGIQQKAEGDEVQKMEMPGIQQKGEGEEVQKKENGPAEAPDGLGERLASSKGGGEPLGPGTKEHMEGAIGADFSGVRVHQGDEAKGMSQDLNAQAFTHGNDIYFNEGKYNPGTTEGDRLLAHELTHTVQQGAAPAAPSVSRSVSEDGGSKSKAQRKPKESADSDSIQRIVEKPKTPPAGGAPAAAPVQPLDISKGFDPTPEIEALFADVNLNKAIDVPVRIGKLVAGTIKVRQTSRPKGTVKGKYSIEANQGIAYDGLGFFNGIKSMGITPVIAIAKGPVAPGQPIGMYYGFQVGKAVSGNPSAFMEQMKKATEALGMVGFKLPTTSASIINAVEGDTLNFTVSGLKVNVAGYVDGEAEFGKQGENFTFKAGMTVDVKGLAQGKFSIERDKEGRLAGEGEIETQIANLSGKVGVKYLGTGDIQVRGSVGIQSEKFSGSVSLMVADKVTADKMMKAELGLPEVEEQGKKKPDAKAPETKTKQNQAVAIWGEVEAKITPWLTGRAKVGISSEGHVTVIGKIAPPSDVVLMEQNTKKIDLFKVEAKGGYGIPFIGQVGFFVSLGMFIKAGFGPLTLRNIAFEGTYSTDPSVMQNFKITGALNISAFAMIALEVEAGLFLTILGHDIKAGINLTAGAGIKAYAEVQPTFEYQEKAGPGGKVGEAWLRGHFEAAAQLFLKLSGEFFVELDSPWWSPAPDKRWPYPLFDVEYPLGKSMGIGGDVDWLVGSPELPELKFSPVEFDPDKFTSDIMADPPPKAGGGKGGEQNPEGKWEAGGDKKDAKPETKGNPGLKGKKEPAEDVSKMTNDQKFIRACEKIGKIGDDAKSKPLALMQLQEKVRKIQSTYGIQSISIKDRDGEAKVTVKHPGKEKQNTNEKEPIKVRLMTVAEMMKLAEAGKKDLEGKVKAKEDPKAHTMKETDAQAIAEEVKGAHYVFEDVTVAQKGDRWEYVLNLAGKTMAVPGSGVEKEKEGQGKDGDKEGKANQKSGKEGKLPPQHIEKKKPFQIGTASHTLTIVAEGSSIEILMASEVGVLNTKIKNFKTSVVNAKTSGVLGGIPVNAATLTQMETELKEMLSDIVAGLSEASRDIRPIKDEREKLEAYLKLHGQDRSAQERFQEIKELEKNTSETWDQLILSPLIGKINRFFDRYAPQSTEFAFDLVNLNPTLDIIKNQMEQIDKHVENIDVASGGTALGRGYAYDALAAEKVLGWLAGRGIELVHVDEFEDILNINHDAYPKAVPDINAPNPAIRAVFKLIDQLASSGKYNEAGKRFNQLIVGLSGDTVNGRSLDASKLDLYRDLFESKYIRSVKKEVADYQRTKEGEKSLLYGKPFAHASKVETAEAELRQARLALDAAIAKFGLGAIVTIPRMDQETRVITVVKDGKKGHSKTVSGLITEADRMLAEIAAVKANPLGYLQSHTDKHGVDLYSIFEKDLSRRLGNRQYLELIQELYNVKLGDGKSVEEFSNKKNDDD